GTTVQTATAAQAAAIPPKHTASTSDRLLFMIPALVEDESEKLEPLRAGRGERSSPGRRCPAGGSTRRSGPMQEPCRGGLFRRLRQPQDLVGGHAGYPLVESTRPSDLHVDPLDTAETEVHAGVARGGVADRR